MSEEDVYQRERVVTFHIVQKIRLKEFVSDSVPDTREHFRLESTTHRPSNETLQNTLLLTALGIQTVWGSIMFTKHGIRWFCVVSV